MITIKPENSELFQTLAQTENTAVYFPNPNLDHLRLTGLCYFAPSLAG
jgi:hypothetical protein